MKNSRFSYTGFYCMQVMSTLVWTLLKSLEQGFINKSFIVFLCFLFAFFFRYLFEGVGFLVSSILISNISEIKRINQNGIKKM